MGRLQRVGAAQRNIALPAADLLSKKSRVFVRPEEVMDNRALTLADKCSLLASSASDACAGEDSPSLRQLASTAIVRVDGILAALKSLDLNEPRHEASQIFSPSFARRGRKSAARRRNPRPEEDDEPPSFAAGARLPSAQKVLAACGFLHRRPMGDNNWWEIRGWKPERGPGARSMASIPMNLHWKRGA